MPDNSKPIAVGAALHTRGTQKRSPCAIDQAMEPCAIVIFGASGDLTSRKLVPSLYRLFINSLLPDEVLIVGTGRKPLEDARFREKMAGAVRAECSEPPDEERLASFIENIFYSPLDYADETTYRQLAKRLEELESVGIPGGNRI